ncbi:hypothetical protein HY449_00630 [Candidatus Pacearchaeota archaeon]|nr:hypothetical protein [Candidatus Pacearchaeota archaeon]
MVEHKVIVDTSVLLAASLNHVCQEEGNLQIEDNFHKISKPLFEHFEMNIDKEYGIITYEIELSAKTQIVNAFLKKIAQKNKIHFTTINLNKYSFSLIKINEALDRNIRLLTRVPINERELTEILKKVSNFYGKLSRNIDKLNPQTRINRRVRSVNFGLRSFERIFATEDESKNFIIHPKLIDKLKRHPPDLKDYRILAQAIYIKKRDKSGNTIVSITSTDYHFSKIRLEDGSLHDYIPSKIEQTFHIKCDWPDEILSLIK